MASGSGQIGEKCPVSSEPGATGVRKESRKTEYRAESPPDGHQHLDRGKALSENAHRAGNIDGAGGAYAGGRGIHLPDGSPVSGSSAKAYPARCAANLAAEQEANRLSQTGQRVSGRDCGGPECGTRAYDYESALLRGGPLDRRCDRDAARSAGWNVAGRGARARVDAHGRWRVFLAGVERGGIDGDGEALLPLVVGAVLYGHGSLRNDAD